MVGWSYSERMDAGLVLTALRHAHENRKLSVGLIFHFDPGSQYASEKVFIFIKNHNWLQRMSKKGDCWDNACAQSFFATMKSEELFLNHFKTRKEAFHCILLCVHVMGGEPINNT